MPAFDDKFKIILRHQYNVVQYLEILDWIETNSIGSVEIKTIYELDLKKQVTIAPGVFKIFYIGFEDSDDALVFKIKFPIR